MQRQTERQLSFGQLWPLYLFLLGVGWGLGASASAAVLPADTIALKRALQTATGKQRIRLLTELTLANKRQNSNIALYYAREALKLAPTTTDEALLARIHGVYGLALQSQGLTVEALRSFEHALPLAQTGGDDTLLANLHNWRGLAYTENGQYLKAETELKRALELFTRLRDTVSMAKAEQNTGIVYYYRGLYDQAAQWYVRAARTLEHVPDADPDQLALLYQNIGIVLKVQKRKQAALEAYRKSLAYSLRKAQPRTLASIYSAMGAFFFDQPNLDSSEVYHRNALRYSIAAGDIQMQSQNVNDLADILRDRGQHRAALDMYRKALTLRDSAGYRYGRAMTLRNIGITYRLMGQYKLSEQYLQQSLAEAKQLGDDLYLAENLEQLAETYRLMGNFPLALSYYEQFKLKSDSLLAVEKSRATEELLLAYETEKKEREIAELENERKLARQRTWAGLGIGTLLLALILLAWNRQRQLRKRDQQLAKAELDVAEERQALLQSRAESAEARQALTQEQLKNAELEQARLAELLEYKNKELMSFALRIIQKNDFLDELKDNLKDLKDQTLDSTNLKRITALIHQNQVLDRERQEFESYVSQVNADFFLKLSKACPDLNETEKRICALLVLNLSSKEMGSLLGVSYKTVDNYRSAIRKKLSIDNDASLTEVLAGL